MIFGDTNDHNIPLKWQEVRFNLQSSKWYEPTLPWVIKLRSDRNSVNDILVYIDDVRAMGWCEWECWYSTFTFAFKCNYIFM